METMQFIQPSLAVTEHPSLCWKCPWPFMIPWNSTEVRYRSMYILYITLHYTAPLTLFSTASGLKSS